MFCSSFACFLSYCGRFIYACYSKKRKTSLLSYKHLLNLSLLANITKPNPINLIKSWPTFLIKYDTSLGSIVIDLKRVVNAVSCCLEMIHYSVLDKTFPHSPLLSNSDPSLCFYSVPSRKNFRLCHFAWPLLLGQLRNLSMPL